MALSTTAVTTSVPGPDLCRICRICDQCYETFRNFGATNLSNDIPHNNTKQNVTLSVCFYSYAVSHFSLLYRVSRCRNTRFCSRVCYLWTLSLFSITAMHESSKIVWTGVKVHVIGEHASLLLENLSCRTTKLSIERRYTECHIFIVMLVVVTSKLEPRNVLWHWYLEDEGHREGEEAQRQRQTVEATSHFTPD